MVIAVLGSVSSAEGGTPGLCPLQVGYSCPVGRTQVFFAASWASRAFLCSGGGIPGPCASGMSDWKSLLPQFGQVPRWGPSDRCVCPFIFRAQGCLYVLFLLLCLIWWNSLALLGFRDGWFWLTCAIICTECVQMSHILLDSLPFFSCFYPFSWFILDYVLEQPLTLP